MTATRKILVGVGLALAGIILGTVSYLFTLLFLLGLWFIGVGLYEKVRHRSA